MALDNDINQVLYSKKTLTWPYVTAGNMEVALKIP